MKALILATTIVAILIVTITTTTSVFATVDEDGAYNEGYDLGYNDYLNGLYGDDVACDSYTVEEDIWCESYINGYEDGQQDASQGE